MIVLEVRAALVNALAYSPDGLTLAAGDSNGRVTLFDAFSGAERARCLPVAGGEAVHSVAFSPDGRLVAAGYLREVVVWSVASGGPLRQHLLSGELTHWGCPTLVAFHPSEDRLAIARGLACINEVAPLSSQNIRALLYQPPHHHVRPPGPWHCLGYLGRDNAPVAGTLDHLVIWQSAGTGHLHWPTGPFVALSADTAGRRLAGARGRGVAVWEPTDGIMTDRRFRTFRAGEQLNAIALTPDGHTLLAGGDDWTVHAWDVDSGQKRSEHNWRLGPVTSLTVSPLGMTAAATGRKGAQVLIWDLE